MMERPNAQYIIPGTDSQSHYLAEYYFTKALRPSNIRTCKMSNKTLLDATIIISNTTVLCSVCTFTIGFHPNFSFCKRSFTGSSVKDPNLQRKSQKSLKKVLFHNLKTGRKFREKGKAKKLEQNHFLMWSRKSSETRKWMNLHSFPSTVQILKTRKGPFSKRK